MTQSRLLPWLLLSLLAVPTSSTAEDTDSVATAHVSATSDCRDLIGFAEHLSQGQDQFRAIGEFERVLYFCDDDSLRQAARRGISRSLFLAGRYRDLVTWLDSADAQPAGSPEDRVLAGHALFRLGEYSAALNVLTPLSESQRKSFESSQASYLAALSLVRMDRGQEALSHFGRVDESSPYWSRSGQYSDLLGTRDRQPTKSPGIAAALGIVPGLGYAYAGHGGTALASLVVNGLLWWATIDAFRDGDDAAGGLYSTFAVGFYLGNIVGSAQSAHRYNEYQAREFQSMFPE